MIPKEFYSKLIHNMNRRADWHDYCQKCFYLITLKKNPSPEVPLFSSLIEKDGAISTDFSWAGWAIYNGIQKFKRDVSVISVWPFVIMPDHVHIILSANQRLDRHFNKFVLHLKALCTQSFRSKSQVRAPSDNSVFDEGFNDRILFKNQQLQNWTNYIKDNPRRLWVMRSHKDFFTRKSIINSDKLPADAWQPGQTPAVQLFGNTFILHYPEITAVRFSRKFTPEEWASRKTEALRIARNGGVLVSPFIHKEEKAILEEGLTLGAKIIKVIPDGFLDRAKPQGIDFDHCAEGRLLLVAMNAGAYTKTQLSRALCVGMNRLAGWIAEHPRELIR